MLTRFNRKLLWLVLLWVMVFWGINALYQSCIDTQILGFIHDDGIYTILAKAMATGQGFRLIHLASAPLQAKYPVLYPFLLSGLWRLNPQFPSNITLLTEFSVVCALLSLGVWGVYLRQRHGVAMWGCVLSVLLIATNYFFVSFATAVMSEMLYLLLSIITVFYAETRLKKPSSTQKTALKWPTLTVLIGLSTLVFHTRVLGLALMAAIFICLWGQQQRKQAIAYGLGSLCLTVLPWALWSHWAQASFSMLSQDQWQAYSHYGSEWQVNIAHGGWLGHISSGLSGLVYGLFSLLCPFCTEFFKLFAWPDNLIGPGLARSYLLTVLMGSYGLIFYLLLRLFRALRQKDLSVSGLYVTFYVLLLVGWNYPEQIGRFLVVVLPWLWLFVLKPFVNPSKKAFMGFNDALGFNPKPALCVLVLGILALWPATRGIEFIRSFRQQHRIVMSAAHEFDRLWPEYQAVLRDIREKTPSNGVIATVWDTVVYLYTDRKTYYIYPPAFQPAGGRTADNTQALQAEALKASLQASRVGYLLWEPHMVNHQVLAPVHPLVAEVSQGLPLVTQSPHKTITLYGF